MQEGVCQSECGFYVKRALATRLLLLVAVTVAACSKRQQTVTTIQGDVYLVMQNGDVKRGAGNTVVLLPDTLPMLSMLAQECDSASSSVLRDINAHMITDADIVVRLWALAMQSRLLHLSERFVAVRLGEAPTGVNARYKFDQVRLGRYQLWATTAIGDHVYIWWTPVALPTDSVKDLDNHVAVEATGQWCDDIRSKAKPAKG